MGLPLLRTGALYCCHKCEKTKGAQSPSFHIQLRLMILSNRGSLAALNCRLKLRHQASAFACAIYNVRCSMLEARLSIRYGYGATPLPYFRAVRLPDCTRIF
jgi:hypothetical protein